MTKEERETRNAAILTARLAGKTSKDIAVDVGISTIQVAKVCREAGHPFTRHRITAAEKQAILQERQNPKATSASIAEKVGVNPKTVRNILLRAGCPYLRVPDAERNRQMVIAHQNGKSLQDIANQFSTPEHRISRQRVHQIVSRDIRAEQGEMSA